MSWVVSPIKVLVTLAVALALSGCAFDPPVPPGGQSWRLAVVNGSAQPAGLFVAIDGPNGMGAIVGIVTPNVVPPGTTVDVWFGVPPGEGWAIFVNPKPGRGPLLTPDDILHAGGIQIGLDGEPGWTGKDTDT